MQARWATLALVVATVTCTAPASREGSPAAVRRVTGTVEDAVRVVLPGGTAPQARPESDQGRLDPEMRLDGVTLVFNESEDQRADLAALITAQLDPRSPHYHAWLTPEEHAARFGMNSADVADIETWARARGLTLHGRSRGATRLHLGGTVAQLEAAFQTEVHHYLVGGERHFALAGPPSVPAAFAATVAGVRGMSDFGPHPAIHARPADTEGATHALAPEDVQTIYDVGPLYAQGFDGTGLTLAIVGQSYYVPTDFTTFRSQTGLPPLQLTDVLVPDSGSATFIDAATEVETELDIEWSGAVAKNAGISYVYTGGNAGFNVENALEYAVDNAVAPEVSMSFGGCEALFGSDIALDESVASQAAVEGITVFASSGDDGAAGCGHDVGIATQGFAVLLPSSIPTVTAVGGTEFNEGTGSYWNATDDANFGSARSYIPETGWNDGVVTTSIGDVIEATGGGSSILYAKPVWQTGAGVPADGARDVPDLALSASAAHDPYLVYLSDPAVVTEAGFYFIGGTSASTPVFASIMTLLNQATQSGKLGTINPVLYGLASTAPSAFHDITSGNNIVPCTEGTTDCPTVAPFQFGFSAGPGYDPVTGLGSVDAAKLVQAWESSLLPMAVSLTASPTSVQVGGPVLLTAIATASGTGPVPKGSITFSSGGAPIGTVAVSTSTAASGDATATAQITTIPQAVGSQSLTARYSGDASYQAATSGAVLVTATGIPSATTLAASPLSTKEGTSIVATATLGRADAGSIPSPTGTVVFGSGASPLATVPLQSGATASLTLTQVGAYALTAMYSGDALYLPSTSTGVVLAIASTLAAAPASTQPPPRGSVAFAATGNVGAVTWALATNASGGTIDGSTGAYTAGRVPDVVDVVTATDSLGGTATATVNVGVAVSIAPPQASAIAGGTVTFVASGGSGSGYVWSLATNASGGLVASDGAYTAGSTGGLDSVQVVDSLGNTAVASVTVSGKGESADAGPSTQPDAGAPGADSGDVVDSGTIVDSGMVPGLDASVGGATDASMSAGADGSTAVAAEASAGEGSDASPAGAAAIEGGNGPTEESPGTASSHGGCGCITAGAPPGSDGLAGGLGLGMLGVSSLARRRRRWGDGGTHQERRRRGRGYR